MIVPLSMLFLLVLVALRPRHCLDAEAALSREQSRAIKGIFVATVFFSHFCSYVSFGHWFDKPLPVYCHWVGQIMVVPFLFYSGFGIFESAKKKGSSYVGTFPRKRILKTLLHFDMAVLLFVAFDAFFAPGVLSGSKIVASLVAWDSVGNSNWFIFAILCAYVFCWAGLALFKNDRFRAWLATAGLCILYIVVVSRFKAAWWWNTILAFPLGCAMSLWRNNLSFAERPLPWCACLAFGVAGLALGKSGWIPSSSIGSQIELFSMSILLVISSMGLAIESKPLSWLGDNVFGIYILQRLPMEFGKILGWNDSHVHLYFLFCLATTLLLAVLFGKATRFVDSKWFQT